VTTPGAVGYFFTVALAAGSTYTAPANDIWQTGNFLGASGQSNFAANAVNSTFDLAFIQHEPGPECSTLIDLSFEDNLDACLRYFQKSYDYGVALGTSGAGVSGIIPTNTTYVPSPGQFPRAMAKTPTATIYNGSTGAAGSVYNAASGASPTVSSVAITTKAIDYIVLATAQVAGQWAYYQYAVDTGW
jgi:hypothetical protein